MSTNKKLFFFDNQQSFAAIQLPFQTTNYVLHIILPYGNTNANDFVKGFNMDIWKTILEQSKEVDITVKLPKFALAWTSQINEQLQALNIKALFQGTTFPTMIDYADGSLHVSSFTQSAGLTINEVGVSMPDITPVSTTQGQTGGANNPPAFIMDRPCLFIVRNVRSGLIVLTSFVRML